MGLGFFFQDPAKIHPADRLTIMEEFHEKVANPAVTWKLKDACAMKARLFVNALEPRSITLIFDSCRKGRFANWALFALIAQHTVEHKMAPKFTQNECASTIIGLGNIAKLTSEGLLGDPESAIKKVLNNRERGAKNRDKTDHTPNIRLKRKKYRNAPITEQNMFPRCGTLVQMLCQTIYSNVMLQKSPGLPPRTIGELLWALGWLYRVDGGMFLGQSGKRVFRKMLEHCTESEKLLARCTTHDLCNMLHGCASVKYQNKKVFNRVCGRLHGRLDKHWGETDPGPGTNEITVDQENTCESDSDSDEERSKDIVQYKQWWDQKTEDSWEISDEDISKLAWACAKLGLYHTFVLRSMSQVVIDRLPDLSDRVIATTVRGYGDLFFEHLKLCEAVAQEITTHKRLASMHEDHLADIMFGLAQMGFRDGGSFEAMAKEVTKRRSWENFSERSLASVVSALGRINFKNKVIVEKIGTEICSRGPGSRFTEEDYQNIVYGFEKLGFLNRTLQQPNTQNEEATKVESTSTEEPPIVNDAEELQASP